MKKVKKLVISILIILIMCNFIMPPRVHAIDVGGILMKPITSLLCGIFDTIAAINTISIALPSNGIRNWTNDTWKEINDSIEQDWAKDQLGNETVADAKTRFRTTMQTANTWSGLGFVSMEDLFLGILDITDINIFEHTSNNRIVNAIKNSVAAWYYALRNLSALGLLCALIYNAIRILMSTVAEQKAHYKEVLWNWVKAVCLVLFVHVLMIFIIHIAELLLGVLQPLNTRYSMMAYVRGLLLGSWDMAQLGYLILYFMLIRYTVKFSVSYFKRFLYTMLLIVIAPVVSLIYAFGKYGHGVFNKWLKEFTCNVFLQPYHLLIYTLLFGWIVTIIQNTSHNLFIAIYVIVLARFIKEAEKYYRGLFGMGEGVAGIGSVDTGEKILKDIRAKVASVGKIGLQVGAAAIGAGAVLNASALAAKTGQAAQAAGTAGRMAQGAKDLKDAKEAAFQPPAIRSGGPDGGGGGFYPPGPYIPDDTDDPNIIDLSDDDWDMWDIDDGSNPEEPLPPNGPNDGIPPSGGSGDSGDAKPIDIDSAEIDDFNAPAITGQVQVDDFPDNIEVENVPDNINVDKIDDANVGVQQLDNGEDSDTTLEVDTINADEVNADEVNADDSKAELDSKGSGLKLNTQLGADAVDKLVNALTGGTNVTVQPGQAPNTESKQGANLGLADKGRQIERARNAIENNDELKDLGSGKKNILLANEVINGNTFEGKQEGNENISQNVNTSSQTVVNRGDENTDVQISSQSTTEENIRYEGVTGKIEKGDIDRIVKEVSEKTGKSENDIKKMISSGLSGGNSSKEVHIEKTSTTQKIESMPARESSDKGGLDAPGIEAPKNDK